MSVGMYFPNGNIQPRNVVGAHALISPDLHVRDYTRGTYSRSRPAIYRVLARMSIKPESIMPMTHVLVLGCQGEKEMDNYNK